MGFLAMLPFLLQGICIGFDEVVFHVRRGLPRWERIGHPLDTLSVISCFLFVFFVPYSPAALKVYIGLAIFSCLMVTKDEFVHKHHSPASENWLHALLFLLHPVVLSFAGMMWAALFGEIWMKWMVPLMDDPGALKAVLGAELVLLSLFFMYQVVFWNIVWRKKAVIKL